MNENLNLLTLGKTLDYLLHPTTDATMREVTMRKARQMLQTCNSTMLQILAQPRLGFGTKTAELLRETAELIESNAAKERECISIAQERDALRERVLGADWRHWFEDRTLPLPAAEKNGKYHYDVLVAIGLMRVGRGWQAAFSNARRMAGKPFRQGQLQDWERSRTAKVPKADIVIAATSPHFIVPDVHKWGKNDRRLVLIGLSEGKTDIEIATELNAFGIAVTSEAVRSVRKAEAKKMKRSSDQSGVNDDKTTGPAKSKDTEVSELTELAA